MNERLQKTSQDERSSTSSPEVVLEKKQKGVYAQPGSWTPSQFKPNDISQIREMSDDPTETYANGNRKKHNVREYTLGEEIANS
ncbi:MAG: hypothetical protein RR505_03935, partial [Raoultibacter sp.]